jgi:hypothetical protein
MSDELEDASLAIRSVVGEHTADALPVRDDSLRFFFDPTNRSTIRWMLGLPDDGKIWCDACQDLHTGSCGGGNGNG